MTASLRYIAIISEISHFFKGFYEFNKKLTISADKVNVKNCFSGGGLAIISVMWYNDNH